MQVFYSPEAKGFYLGGIHPAMPGDVVEISEELHAELLDAQTQGAEIVPGAGGIPVAMFPPDPTVEDLRDRAVARVKAEANRRIEAVAPVWRQMNALREGAALDWEQIDAIRAASDVLEATIATITAEQLAALDVTANDNWPSAEAAA